MKEAAGNGNHFAAYRLGKEYLTGEHAPQTSKAAIRYLRDAAGAGSQYAQYLLGKLYLMGREVPRGREQAIHWLTLSASQGNQYAQLLLERQDGLQYPAVLLSVTHLLYHLSRVFQERSLPQSSAGLRIDRKRRQQLQGKRIALGHKPDDHQEEPAWGGMTMGDM